MCTQQRTEKLMLYAAQRTADFGARMRTERNTYLRIRYIDCTLAHHTSAHKTVCYIAFAAEWIASIGSRAATSARLTERAHANRAPVRKQISVFVRACTCTIIQNETKPVDGRGKREWKGFSGAVRANFSVNYVDGAAAAAALRPLNSYTGTELRALYVNLRCLVYFTTASNTRVNLTDCILQRSPFVVFARAYCIHRPLIGRKLYVA